MARWEPNAQGRLVEAAMALFKERGFDDTTVADIAAAAGLTERTFFRYYADKREVLFGGGVDLAAELASHVAEAPDDAGPFDAVGDALEALAADAFAGRRTFARRRARLIGSEPRLQERELIKLASWTDALAAALTDRGVDDGTAELAAEAGMAAFRVAFRRWVDGPAKDELTTPLRAALDELRTVAGRA